MKLEITIQDEEKITAKLDTEDYTGTVEMDSLRLRTIRLFRTWIETGRLLEREGLEVLGSHLYQAIFNGDISRCFENAVKKSSSSNRLRVRLFFQPNAIKLANLPWEYLFRPETETSKGYFLSTRTQLTLFRFMPREGQPEIKPFKTRLKVLVVFAEPDGAQPAEASELEYPSIPTIKSEMKKMFDDLNVQVDFLEYPTDTSLPEILDSFNPHVMHFIGHGIIDKKSNLSKIAIMDENKNLILIRDNLFASYVENSGNRNLRLVFLHLTECAHHLDINPEENYSSFAGMAPALIKANIPAVVAMQFPIQYPVAKKFYESLYKELAAGNDIDSAVQTGREKIALDPKYSETHIFGTPVLSVYREDRIIEPVPIEVVETAQGGDLQRISQMASSQPSAGVAVATPISPPTGKAIDPGILRKVADAKRDELGLDKEQQDKLGVIISNLYREKIKGQGNYQGVLEAALAEYADPDVQKVIFAMMQELEA
jgi:hypothetical protein